MRDTSATSKQHKCIRRGSSQGARLHNALTMGTAVDVVAQQRGAAHNVKNTYFFTLFYWAARR